MTYRPCGMSPKGAQIRFSTAPTAHVCYRSCRHPVCTPPKLTALQGHATNTPSGDTVAPESSWLGNSLSTKCQHGRGKRWRLPGTPLSSWSARSECPGVFPEVK